MDALLPILSFIPILLLIGISVWKGVKTGIYLSLFVTGILFFVWESSLPAFFASIVSAFVGTLNILMIIFGAVLLYQTMEQKKYIEGIEASLLHVHPDKSFRFFFVAFFLTAFFENVAGFGTPGAIVPLLLISMGFSPILSITTVLLIDGIFSMAGAVGTPVTAGLQTPLQLTPPSVSLVYVFASVMMLFAGTLIVILIQKQYTKETGEHHGNRTILLFAIVMIPMVLIAYNMNDISGILSTVFMGVFSYVFLFKRKNLQFLPWIPYVILILLLLIPKVLPALQPLLNYSITFPSIFGSTVSAQLQPLKSPLIPFVLATLVALSRANNYHIDFKPVVTKTLAVFAVLFPSLTITEWMLNSGGSHSSMIHTIAAVFEQTGKAYPLISPLLGVVGTFVSGSTTVSNMIFGSVQYAAARNLSLQEEVILSLQLTGASLGNAICLYNIISAAAVAGITDYGTILKKNLPAIIGASLICATIGYGLLFIIS